MDRNAEFQSHQHRKRIYQRVREIDAVDFFNVLTGPELLEKTEALLPQHRERLYPPTVTLSMFMRQALDEDGSCQKAVNGWAARCAAEGLSASSVHTGAYCKARQRLPVEMAQALTREVGHLLSARAPAGWGWRGRAVKLIDGSTVSMPDTKENQARYAQPCSQAAGVGFPIARIVAVICLSTGAVCEAGMGAYEGEGGSELALFRGLSAAFCRGDIALADALYCNYFVLAILGHLGVDVLFEQHGGRITDFRRGERLGARDHRVHWPKPRRPQWMTQEQYEAFPAQLTVREVQVGGQVLVTTLLDQRKVRKQELSELYGRRWNVELDLRNIKSTLGMELLSCHSPQMNEKQMWVHLLAYNLIRLLMAQAALNAGIHPRQLSFKHTVQLWTEWTARCSGRGEVEHTDRLLRLIAQVRVGNRPGRLEPRAVKRRPKAYPWLKTSRAEAREQVRVHGHL